ncbi:MAG: nucleotidyl transferase AbiEii/AbiGii toxin family protein [bacterium]
MIDKLFTLESITDISIKNNNADKILIEKVLRAFSLLEGLAEQNLDFVFKGGTSLILLLDSIKRLSIDIDIIIEEKPEEFDTLLKGIAKNKGFTKVLNQVRISQTNVPKTHYKFYYIPVITTNLSEDNILLDILFEKPYYNTLKHKIIKFPLLSHHPSQIKVKVPSLEDILGDKLTAFAPNTTGIPYFKNDKSMRMEIIKQLYDIANLFDVANDLNLIKGTFIKFATIELGYRNQSTKSYTDVLDDVYNTALCITLRGADGNGN